MREIKFRQPIFSKGIFKEFHYWGIGIEQGGELSNVGYMTFSLDVTNPKDSQQYTGLKDKNGKEIYEGDVVKSFHNNECSVIRFGEYKHIVGFEEEDIYNCIGFYFGKDIIPFAKDIYGQTNKYEVIGNIYENPELLNND